MSGFGLFSIILSYLVGSIPFGLLLSRKSGIDIRSQGSGNIGATNVTRLLGKKLGALTLLCDAGKGFLPIACLSLCTREPLVLGLAGAATVLGHMFPVYLGFHGGKGVATALGLFLFLDPCAVVLALLVFLIALWRTNYVSVASLAASASLPLWIWILRGSSWHIPLALVVMALIWSRHRGNIERLRQGTEKTWKKA